MPDFKAPELSLHSGIRDDERIYRGNSMFRVFAPGDILRVRPLRAGDAEPGDIICFDGMHGETVHRVVHKNADAVVTMGDNNPRPDAEPLRPDETVWLVTERCDIRGGRHAIYGGKRGMRIFRLNRMRRLLKRFPDRLAGVLRRILIVKYHLHKKVRFGADEIYYFRNTPVLRRDASGKEAWLSPWYRAVFKAGGK